MKCDTDRRLESLAGQVVRFGTRGKGWLGTEQRLAMDDSLSQALDFSDALTPIDVAVEDGLAIEDAWRVLRTAVQTNGRVAKNFLAWGQMYKTGQWSLPEAGRGLNRFSAELAHSVLNEVQA